MFREVLYKVVGEGFSGWRVSKARIDQIVQMVSEGSVPHLGYYALISAATVIASLGLVQNSGAVVIGAMLVSPLMTPIFGMSAGIVRGESGLFFRGLRAEFGGVALAILFGMLFGALPLLTELTPEISARLKPNLLDLLVAVFAGFAGTWAVVDERISPVLPGVAISTAIIPPLAVCGICLSRGAFSGAQGAFLLFFANFLAILIVSSLIFWRAGLGSRTAAGERTQLLPPVLVTVLCLAVVAVLLTQSLLRMVEIRQRTEIIRQVLSKSEGTHPIFSIAGLEHHEAGGVVNVLAKLRTSRALGPDRVAQFQSAMSKQMSLPVNLTVSCLLTRDVSSTNATDVAAVVNLNGIKLDQPVHPDVRRARIAEQTLREAFRGTPDLWLLDVDLAHFDGQPVVIASVRSHRIFVPDEVGLIEKAIRHRLGESNVELVIRCHVPYDITPQGRILLGERHFKLDDKQEQRVVGLIHSLVGNLGNLFVTNMDGIWRGDHWEIYAEIQGDRIITPLEVRRIEKQLREKAEWPVKLRAWSKAELVATDEKYFTHRAFLEQQKGITMFGRIEKNVQDILRAKTAPK